MATPKRNSKGRFIKRSTARRRKARPKSRTSRRSLGYVKERKMAKGKRRKSSGGRRRSGGGGGSTGTTSGRTKAEIAGAGAAWGWLTSPVKRKEAKGEFWADKLPEVKAIGKDGTVAVLAHFGAAQSSGQVRKWLDRLSVALAGSAAVNLGRANFKEADLQARQIAQMSGDDELSGTIDGDEDDVAYQQDA